MRLFRARRSLWSTYLRDAHCTEERRPDVPRMLYIVILIKASIALVAAVKFPESVRPAVELADSDQLRILCRIRRLGPVVPFSKYYLCVCRLLNLQYLAGHVVKASLRNRSIDIPVRCVNHLTVDYRRHCALDQRD